jgi:DNA-binding transcriptional regulator YhcF (GntR family)
MKFWFVHSGDVSIHDQIVTQVSLGVLAGDPGPGEQLPSIRTMAQRFDINAATVSAAYRELERERWVEFRRGSGVFVRDTPPREIKGIRPALHLDRLIANLIQAARASDMSPADLRARILGHLDAAPPARLLLIESDVELRRIVMQELHESVKLPSGFSIGCTDLPRAGDTRAIAAMTAQLPGSLVMVLPSKAEALRAVLPAEVAMLILQVRSIPQLLAPWLPAPRNTLVGVASRWPPFLAFAKIMLVAAGFDADALLLRDASLYGWTSGLNQARTVICDSHTATLLPPSIPRIAFNLLAEQSIADLQRMVRASLDGRAGCDTSETATKNVSGPGASVQTQQHETNSWIHPPASGLAYRN